MKIHELIADDTALEIEVTKYIRKAGVPLHIKGYEYLRTAIMLVMKDYMKFDSVTKILYPEIAKLYNTTPSRVERAIRHAIEVSWTKGDPMAIYELFENSGQIYQDRPTNSEYIALVADNLRLATLK